MVVRRYVVGDRIIHAPPELDYNVSRRRYVVAEVLADADERPHYRVRCERNGHELVLPDWQMILNPQQRS